MWIHVRKRLHPGLALPCQYLPDLDHATHNRRLQRRLVVAERYLWVANYAINTKKGIDMTAHSARCRHLYELRHDHVGTVELANKVRL